MSAPESRLVVPPKSAPPYPSRRGAGLLASFGHALRGLLHAVVHQRNMRIHLISAILVGLVGSGIGLGLAEKVTLIFCVVLVFFAEILNTALETLVDLAVQQFDEKARVVKDAAAAGVLVLATGTVVIFAAILATNWDVVVGHGADVLRQFAIGIPLGTLAAFLIGEWPRRPAWVDTLLALGCLGLWAATLPRTRSYVFSALTLGLLVLCALAAAYRRGSSVVEP